MTIESPLDIPVVVVVVAVDTMRVTEDMIVLVADTVRVDLGCMQRHIELATADSLHFILLRADDSALPLLPLDLRRRRAWGVGSFVSRTVDVCVSVVVKVVIVAIVFDITDVATVFVTVVVGAGNLVEQYDCTALYVETS